MSPRHLPARPPDAYPGFLGTIGQVRISPICELR